MKKTALIFLIILAAVILTACSTGAQSTPTPTSAPNTTPSAVFEGRLEPIDIRGQFFTAPGQISEVLVKDGDTVAVDQPLARLTPSTDAQSALARAHQEVLSAAQALDALKKSGELSLAQAKIALLDAQDAADKAQTNYDADPTDRAKANLDGAQAALTMASDRLANLQTGQGIDPDARQAAEARLTSANAALAGAEAMLAARELRSTAAGTVVDLSLKSGDWVTPGQSVITLADYSGWLVNTDNLSETAVAAIRTGQGVQLVFDALPEVTLAGEVTHINARYEEKRGDITYTVSIKLTQGDPRLRWGMTAAVQFLP